MTPLSKLADPDGESGVARTDIETVARVVHEALRAYRAALGEEALPPWTRAPAWMRQSTIDGIRFRLDHPDAPPSAQHDRWMAEKRAAGWKHGPTKDAAKKTHPMLTPYRALPETERRKDMLFAAVVDALTQAAPRR
jgi:hypothetical protein